MSTRYKVLSSALGLLILIGIGAILYVSYSSPTGGRFTEFYLLGAESKAGGYPTELVVGEEGKVLVGIANHEYQKMSYRVVVKINGIHNGDIGPVVLEHEQEWQQEASFTPERAGEEQEVEFLLYKEGEVEPYDSLYLWLDVMEKRQSSSIDLISSLR